VDSAGYDYPGVRRHLEVSRNLHILDLGCGNGTIALKLLEEGFDIYGVDASETGISMANKLYHKNELSYETDRFFVADFDERWGGILGDVRFDTIISTQVIEHVYSPKSYIGLCKSILPPNGILIITTPYHGYFKNLALALTGKMDQHFTALWEGGHIKFFSKKTMGSLLQANGFNILKFEGLGRVPFLWKSLLVVARRQE